MKSIRLSMNKEKKSSGSSTKRGNLNTYLVSHGWTHPLLEKIEIIKEENISYLNE